MDLRDPTFWLWAWILCALALWFGGLVIAGALERSDLAQTLGWGMSVAGLILLVAYLPVVALWVAVRAI